MKTAITIELAAREYHNRKLRIEHPAGKFDNARRWYPAETEKCAECRTLREPSRAWPYSLMLHCRTARHIALKYSLDADAIKRVAKTIQ